MARQLRLNIPNGFYHVMNRGNRRDNIFRSDVDRIKFLEKLNDTSNKYNLEIYTYCLMDNHYHLFLKTIEPNLSQALHYLNTSYANWFRAKYKLAGSVFQGRYKAILVDKDNYSYQLSAYIHLNPVRARITEKAEDFLWSSYQIYLFKSKNLLDRLDRDFILGQFHKDRRKAVLLYKKYVESFKASEVFTKMNILGIGEDKFIQSVIKMIDKKLFSQEIPETHNPAKKLISYEKILKICMEYYELDEVSFKIKTRNNNYRKILIYLLQKLSNMSLKEIGEKFEINYTGVSQSVYRFEKELLKNKTLQNKIRIVESKIKTGK